MALAVLVCEERFRSDLEPLVAGLGYQLLGAGGEGSAADGAAPPRLAPDSALVVTERGGSGRLQKLERAGLRYWLVTVGAPGGDGFELPARQPHRRLLSLGPSNAAYLSQLLDDWRERELVRVDVFTFGYRNGLPAEADWVVDTRFLDSPYWIPEMRELPGSDPGVRAHLMTQAGAQQLVGNFLSMLLALLPMYRAQRRSVLRLAVGCTGGQHRSVAVATEMVERINRTGSARARFLETAPLHVPQTQD